MRAHNVSDMSLLPASIAQWGERRIAVPTGSESLAPRARYLLPAGWPAVSGSGRITGQMKPVSGAGRVRLGWAR